MSFKLEFETDNAAFDDGNAENEIARILRGVSVKIQGGDCGTIHDVNGNRIGSWSYDPPEEEEEEEPPQPSARCLRGGTIIAQNEECILTSFFNGGAYALTNTAQSREVFVQDESAIRFRAEYAAFDAQSADPLAEMWALYSEVSQEIG